MYLLNTSTKRLEEFGGPGEVKYAILSHRWTEAEVTFQDIKDLSSCSEKAISKVTSFCRVALELGYDWCWIDTCCINKTSSAELSEAINSMFSWYQHAGICIIYLQDVTCTQIITAEDESNFRASTWFLRSWTLQELLASARHDISYYNANWQFLGYGEDLSGLVSEITTISRSALCGESSLSDYSVAKRMSWASMRSATRIEDVAYSLLGIFDIQMPLVYGEGHKAFRRLQQAIMTTSDDEDDFRLGISYSHGQKLHKDSRNTYELMSRGVRFDSAHYVRADDTVDILVLNVKDQRPGQQVHQVGIYMKLSSDGRSHYRVTVSGEDQLWRSPVKLATNSIEGDKSIYMPFDHNETVVQHVVKQPPQRFRQKFITDMM